MKTKIIFALAICILTTAIVTRVRMNSKATVSKINSAYATADDMNGFSDASKMAIKMMEKKYGPPAEKTSMMMVWNSTGPWKKTVVFAKEYKHDFPMPHTDVMQQFIDYKVPTDKFTDL